MSWRALFIIGAVALLGASGEALPEGPTAEEGVAHVIASALALDDDDARWAYGWQAVGSRLGGPVNWHLAPPDERDAELTHRTGWIDGRFQSAGVAACGEENVRLIAFRLSDREEDSTPLILATLREDRVDLKAQGETFLVARPGWAPGRLRISGACTSPNAAVMQRCWTEVRLALREDDQEALALECRAP